MVDSTLRAIQRAIAWLRAWLAARSLVPLPSATLAPERAAHLAAIRADVDWALRQPICACLIVKNEAKVIERCLRTLLPHVTHWAIVDTGSTDGTQDIVRRVMADLPGELVERPWVDFSTNRNQSLELGRDVLSRDDRSDGYLFVIDADEELVSANGTTFPNALTADAYAIRLRMDNHSGTWVRRVLVRADQPWHYVYELHEVLTLPEGTPMTDAPQLPLEVQSHNDSHRNDAGRDKYMRDAATLRGMLEREPDSPRNWYYLGQALAGAYQIDEAIAAFRRRVEFGGWPEERFYAAYMLAGLTDLKQGGEPDDAGKRTKRSEADRHAVLNMYLDAYALRPSRAEPLWAAAVVCNDSGKPELAEMFARRAAQLKLPNDAFMVHEDVYQWRAFDELIGALAALGRQAEAIHYIDELIAAGRVPDSDVARFSENARRMQADLDEWRASQLQQAA